LETARGTDIDVEGGGWLRDQRRVGDYRALPALPWIAGGPAASARRADRGDLEVSTRQPVNGPEIM
jgi:hypothetical protein